MLVMRNSVQSSFWNSHKHSSQMKNYIINERKKKGKEMDWDGSFMDITVCTLWQIDVIYYYLSVH